MRYLRTLLEIGICAMLLCAAFVIATSQDGKPDTHAVCFVEGLPVSGGSFVFQPVVVTGNHAIEIAMTSLDAEKWGNGVVTASAVLTDQRIDTGFGNLANSKFRKPSRDCITGLRQRYAYAYHPKPPNTNAARDWVAFNGKRAAPRNT
jgi:hypothetical protein